MPEQLIIELIRQGTANSCQLFSYFSNQPWAMLLDSTDGAHPDSRFDIMVAAPKVKLITRGQHTEIIDEKGSHISLHDPLDIVIQQVHANLIFDKNNTALRFIGGAVGYFGYDLGGSFERLPHDALDDLHTPDMAVGIYDWALIKDNHKNQLWFVSQDKSLTQVAPGFIEFLACASPPDTDFVLTEAWQANMTYEQYAQRFEQVQQYLLSGDCYQINLAQRFTASYKGDEYHAYRALAQSNQAPFSAFLRFEHFTVLSISPERLLQLNGSNIQTKPIKGTLRRSSDPQTDRENAKKLQNSAKDQAENVMIVDLLRNDIGKVSVAGSVKVPSLFAIESFPAVHHLVSTITGVLDDKYQATDLLRSAFPGGAITGAPKIRAM
ncbi:MAG: chorismate-binding protein, partial [Psychrosphaera sp.]|nr:chorismate-binding protein [Psychrosphaera sp.]